MKATMNVYLSLWQVAEPGSHEIVGPLLLTEAFKRLVEYTLSKPFKGARYEFRIGTDKAKLEYGGTMAANQASSADDFESFMKEFIVENEGE